MKFYNTLLLVASVVTFSSCTQSKEKDIPWENLIKDNTLEGWSVKGGESTYEVVDGTIIGTLLKTHQTHS